MKNTATKTASKACTKVSFLHFLSVFGFKPKTDKKCKKDAKTKAEKPPKLEKKPKEKKGRAEQNEEIVVGVVMFLI